MDKQQLISLIEEKLNSGTISKSDLLHLAGQDQNTSPATNSNTVAATQIPDKQEISKNLTAVLYSIGAIIVIAGVGILTAQHWTEIGFAGRILVTLGISLLAYIVAMMFKTPEQKTISSVLFTLSAALAPLGAYVLLDQAGVKYTSMTQLIVALILAIIFGTALYVSKRNILVLLSIAYTSWAYYALVVKVFDYSSWNSDVLKWATVLIGASYLFLSYSLQSRLKASDDADAREKHSIQNILYGFGTIAIIGVSLSYDGIFDLITIALIFGAFYGSVFLKSRSMLILAALFLVGDLIKLTTKYFIDSLGWPVALIFVGLLVIATGYLTFYLNKKYMSQN